jgi:SCY1-like protein 1
LNEDNNIIHGNIQLSSIFISRSGEWKLGGLDFVTPQADGNAMLFVRQVIVIILY